MRQHRPALAEQQTDENGRHLSRTLKNKLQLYFFIPYISLYFIIFNYIIFILSLKL